MIIFLGLVFVALFIGSLGMATYGAASETDPKRELKMVWGVVGMIVFGFLAGSSFTA